jgi:phospholipid/cholesterol/gamma-HCH transport system substrate-binding protein
VKRLVTAAVLAIALAVTSGCGFHGVYSLPLPGAAGTGSHTYTVKVQFADVLDLVPYSAVKVNGATVGHVRSIKVEDRHALVSCQIRNEVHLPANAIASVQQTSVLGEKFVEIEPPVEVAPAGRLHDGSVIPLERTDTDASVEEVLGALSLLLDGGGVGKLQTISHELSTAMKGREGVTRDLLVRLNGFVSGLDRQKGSIISALEGLDRLARAVRGQESSLVQALEDMPGALRILADDRAELTKMLTSLRHFGDVAADVVTRAHEDLVGNLRDLRPTLARLAKVGETIPEVLTVLITDPTADSVEQEYFGDYGNLALTMDVSAKSLLNTFGPLAGLPGPTGREKQAKPRVEKKVDDAVGGLGDLPALPDLGPVTRWAPGTTFEDLMLGALS